MTVQSNTKMLQSRNSTNFLAKFASNTLEVKTLSDMQVELSNQSSQPVSEKRQQRTKKQRTKLIILNFIMLWLLLIVGGLYGAYTYMNKMEERLTTQMRQETEQKLKELDSSYETRINELDSSYQEKVAALGEQIDELNQLLTFVKDNSSDKNDDSNQLYSQINEIKSQLQKLQKSMELLK